MPAWLAPILGVLLPILLKTFAEMMNAPDTAEIAKPNTSLDALWFGGMRDKTRHP